MAKAQTVGSERDSPTSPPQGLVVSFSLQQRVEGMQNQLASLSDKVDSLTASTQNNANRMDGLEGLLSDHLDEIDKKVATGTQDVLTAIAGMAASGRLLDRFSAWFRGHWIKVAGFGAGFAALAEWIRTFGEKH